MSDIEFPEDLQELERAAWKEIQAGTLTVATALAVHQAVGAFAVKAGLKRLEVEMQLKRTVRHPQMAG